VTDQTNRFVRFVFRTTDVSAGRAFYASVLGDAVTDTTFVPLHEQALARGARPHWLGLLGVADVDAAARAVEARGGTRLGPTAPYFEGGELAVVRDPGGAIVGFGTPPATPLGTRTTWRTSAESGS